MYTKKIYFAGGSFYELQEVFARIEGVIGVTTGYINSETQSPTHEEVHPVCRHQPLQQGQTR